MIPGKLPLEDREVFLAGDDRRILVARTEETAGDFREPSEARDHSRPFVVGQELLEHSATKGSGFGRRRRAGDPHPIAPCAATALRLVQAIVGVPVNPGGYGFAVTDQGHHHRPARISHRKVGGAIERIDQPHNGLSGDRIDQRRGDRNGLLADYGHAGQECFQPGRDHCLGFPIGDRYHLAGRFLLDVMVGKHPETRHDVCCRGFPQDLPHRIHIDTRHADLRATTVTSLRLW
jgi:hypothetical protein